MPLTLAQRQDRFRAALLGFAVGDALGFAYRGTPPATLARMQLADDFASRPRGKFAKGQFSDDTQVMLAIAESVTREQRIDGRSAAAHFSWLWQEGVILHPPLVATIAAEALIKGTPWMSSGADLGVRDPSCLSRGVVLGLWAFDVGPKLAHEAGVLSVITHKDPWCAAAVAALARAVQLGCSGENLSPQAICAEMSNAAAHCSPALADEIYYLPRVFGWEPDKALQALRRIGVGLVQLEAEPGLPTHVAPVLLSALYAALKVPHDFREASNMLLRQGGEVDVATAVCGAIMGSFLGCDGIPARLRKHVLYAESLTDAADKLFDARLQHEIVPATALAVVRR